MSEKKALTEEKRGNPTYSAQISLISSCLDQV